MRPPPTTGGVPEAATATVAVNGADATGVQVVPAPPVVVSGRVILDATGAAVKPSSIRMLLTPVAFEDAMFGSTFPATPKDDFTFELGATPERVLLRTLELPPGWGLKGCGCTAPTSPTAGSRLARART